ncbi:hypothetical protein AAY473_013603 [Plecturocebus cupreus]
MFTLVSFHKDQRTRDPRRDHRLLKSTSQLAVNTRNQTNPSTIRWDQRKEPFGEFPSENLYQCFYKFASELLHQHQRSPCPPPPSSKDLGSSNQSQSLQGTKEFKRNIIAAFDGVQ